MRRTIRSAFLLLLAAAVSQQILLGGAVALSRKWPTTGPDRRKPRKHYGLKRDVPHLDDIQFKQWFGFTREQTLQLFETIRGDFPHRSTRAKYSDYDFLLIFLYRMRNVDFNARVFEKFGVSEGTGNVALKTVRRILAARFSSSVQFPWDRLPQTAADFSSGWGIDCCGVIDGLSVRYCSTALQDQDRKGSRSLLNIIGCDARYRITFAFVGAPGRANDPQAFRRSHFYRIGLPRLAFYGHYLLADAIFAANKGVLTVYDHGNLASRTSEERRLQWRMVRTRSIIERVFAMIYSRMPYLKCLRTRQASTALEYIKAAIVLHNFYVSSRFQPLTDDLQDVLPDESEVRAVLGAGMMSVAEIRACGWAADTGQRHALLGGPTEGEELRRSLISRLALRAEALAARAEEAAAAALEPPCRAEAHPRRHDIVADLNPTESA